MDLLDLVFPKRCVGCGRFGSYVCDKCEVGMWEGEQICPSCCRNSRYGSRHKYCKGDLEGLTCLWAYEGVARKLITRAKYSGQFDTLEFLILNFKFEINEQMFEFNKFLKQNPVVVPVPLHQNRLRERGFNQAEIIAKSFALRHALSCDSHLLLRTKDTKRQVGKSREERLMAMEDAFTTPSGPPPNLGGGRGVVLIDDVWTTGATMRECAKMLKRYLPAGRQVWGLVLAR